MALEFSQYLENYLWPNFTPERVSFSRHKDIVPYIIHNRTRDVVKVKINSFVGVCGLYCVPPPVHTGLSDVSGDGCE